MQNFQDSIVQLKRVAKTEIEPPSVKLARELTGVKPPQAKQDEKVEPPQATQGEGYYL